MYESLFATLPAPILMGLPPICQVPISTRFPLRDWYPFVYTTLPCFTQYVYIPPFTTLFFSTPPLLSTPFSLFASQSQISTVSLDVHVISPPRAAFSRLVDAFVMPKTRASRPSYYLGERPTRRTHDIRLGLFPGLLLSPVSPSSSNRSKDWQCLSNGLVSFLHEVATSNKSEREQAKISFLFNLSRLLLGNILNAFVEPWPTTYPPMPTYRRFVLSSLQYLESPYFPSCSHSPKLQYAPPSSVDYRSGDVPRVQRGRLMRWERRGRLSPRDSTDVREVDRLAKGWSCWEV